MKKSAYISDILFAFASSFLLSLCAFRYFRFSLTVSALLALLVGAATGTIVRFILASRKKKRFFAKKDEENRDKLLLHFALNSRAANLDYAFSCLQKISEKENRPELSPEKTHSEDGISYIETPSILFFPVFTLAPLSGDCAAGIIGLETEKEKQVLCGGLTPEAERLFQRFAVNFMTGNELFLRLKNADCLPEKYLGDKASKVPVKKRRIWFAKTNARRFFTGGLLILLTSLITPFPFYYLLFGSALILSSVFIRIFGYR